jgi:hypothetical protein
VIARRDKAGTAQELLAFCVPTRPGDPLADGRVALRPLLLPHQLPAVVLSVPAFPVTARGKLDERALLALVPQAVSRAVGTEPVDPTMRLIAEIFRAVLDLPYVPVEVPFVELGGSSLSAGRVCARLAARLGRPVPVSRLYEHRTVEALATWLRTTEPRPAPADPDSADVPLTSMQVVYLTKYLVDPTDLTGLCLLTWVIDGDLDRAGLESAVAAVHRRHEPLRAAYVAEPRPAARLVDIDPPALEILPNQPSVDAAMFAVRALLAEELVLGDGEVWRTALAPVGAGETTVFACVVHHIAFDGWSEAVLADDLAAAYNAVEPMADRVPPTLRAAHVDDRRRVADADAHVDRLVAELTGVPDLRWPSGITEPVPGPPKLVEVMLAPDVIDDVDALAHTAGVSRFTVLLAEWAACVAEITGQDDFAVGVPVALRYGAGLEHAIGCHINMLCLRLRGAALDGGSVGLRRTARLIERAMAAQDVPIARLFRHVRPTLLFALQDNVTPQLRLAGPRTRFVRQPYLDLPLELHTELWPTEDGGLLLTVYFRPEAVPEAVAGEIAKRFTDRLNTIFPGARP